MKKIKRIVRPATKHREARGVSKIIILAVVALILAAGGGYYLLGSKGGSPMTSMIKPALNPNCEYKDPELCKFMNNWAAQTNYAVATMTKMAGMQMESLYEIDGDEKFHSVSKQNGKEDSNMISIGDTTYTLDYTDNKWWKMTTKPDDTTTSQVKEIKDEFKISETGEEDKTVYKFITKEACGDKTCFKYEMITPDSSDTKQYMWFDDSEYLMRKTSTESKEYGNSESVYTYGGVSISVPTPVKEGNPYDDESSENPQVKKMMEQYQQEAAQQSYESESPVTNEEY